ncbi:BlaI/MecI/CopY family transcriptional regulator [Nonomuraea sp. NPDC049504]|uniref:BlaI/MecI/CopY family transcriptional regulator n=1 Tax=Nonomuraea sp. NPDC049504 TaxID=3154729 RepID=UPI0034270249
MRSLGELESAIMEHIWSCDAPVPVRDVLERLRGDRTLAYTTVMTVMDKLHKKGLLRRVQHGRAYWYEPVLSHEAYSAQLMQEALAHGGNQAMTLIHFLERLPPEEHAALASALRRTARQ